VVEDLDNYQALKVSQPSRMEDGATHTAPVAKFNPETDLASIFASHDPLAAGPVDELELPAATLAGLDVGVPDLSASEPAELDFGGLELSEPAPFEVATSEHSEPSHMSFETPTFVPKSVLCVESQSEIQDALRKTLSKMGYRVLLVSDAQMAAERYRESPVDAVIFDLDGQDEDALEALDDMHDKGVEDEQRLVAVVLLGHRQGNLKEKLPTGDRLRTLIKPIKMKEVQDAIHELLPMQ
jgi:CheY-like chemotaxis protein